MGRQTFEDRRRYWRNLSDDTAEVSAYLNQVQKYVVSSTPTEPDWDRTDVFSRDPVAEVRAAKDDDGTDVVLTGSITLAHALIEAGLVDEYRLFVCPTVQGRARRLVPGGFELPRLELLESRSFRSGIALLKYAATVR